MYGQNRQRLRELGLTIPPDTVIEVVRRLEGHASLYSISERPGTPPLVAKGTARKIHDLWQEGKMGFLMEVPPEKRDIARAEHIARAAGALILTDRPLGEKAQAAHYMGIMAEMPSVEWSIHGLENAGVSQEEAPQLLLEYDSLNPGGILANMTALAEWEPDDPDSPPFPGMARRLFELHYLVGFTRDNPGAPFEIVQRAASLYVQGLVGVETLLTQVGLDILRYQIWRSPKHLAAFSKAQQPHKRLAMLRVRRQVDRLEEEIRDLLQESAEAQQQEEDTNARQLTATE